MKKVAKRLLTLLIVAVMLVQFVPAALAAPWESGVNGVRVTANATPVSVEPGDYVDIGITIDTTQMDGVDGWAGWQSVQVYVMWDPAVFTLRPASVPELVMLPTGSGPLFVTLMWNLTPPAGAAPANMQAGHSFITGIVMIPGSVGVIAPEMEFALRFDVNAAAAHGEHAVQIWCSGVAPLPPSVLPGNIAFPTVPTNYAAITVGDAEFSVTYNLNGGTGGPTPLTTPVSNNSTHTLRGPAPTHDDAADGRYVLFQGWTDAATAPGRIDVGGSLPTIVTQVAIAGASRTVHAVWAYSTDGITPDFQRGTYTVTYHVNGGTFPNLPVGAQPGDTSFVIHSLVNDTHTLRAPAQNTRAPVNDRTVSFVGWSAAPITTILEGTDVAYLSQLITSVPSQALNANFDVYAVWGFGYPPDVAGGNVPVIYNLNGGVGGPTPNTIQVPRETTHTLRMTPAPLRGNVDSRQVSFVGWSTTQITRILEGADTHYLSQLVTSVDVGTTGTTVYAVWGFGYPPYVSRLQTGIRGQVTRQSDGTEVEDVTIVVESIDGTTSWMATTNAEGRYSITGLTAGEYRVTAIRAGYDIVVQTPVTVVADQMTDVNFVLQDDGGTQPTDYALIVTVANAPADAVVMVVDGAALNRAAGTNVWTLFTDAPLTGRVAAGAPNYTDDDAQIPLYVDRVATVDLTMTRIILQDGLGGISGQVTRLADGTPIAGAVVIAESDDGATIVTVRTNATGHYTFPDLAPGSFTVMAAMAGYETAKQTVTVNANQWTTADFALDIDPTTTDSYILIATVENAPATGVTVRADGVNMGREGTNNVWVRFSPAPLTGIVEASANGFITVSENIPAYENRMAIVELTLLADDGGLDPNMGGIRGTVTRADNSQPIADATVIVQSATGMWQTTTNNAGAYAIPNLTPGVAYTVTVIRAGYYSQLRTAGAVAADAWTTENFTLTPSIIINPLSYTLVVTVANPQDDAVVYVVNGQTLERVNPTGNVWQLFTDAPLTGQVVEVTAANHFTDRAVVPAPNTVRVSTVNLELRPYTIQPGRGGIEGFVIRQSDLQPIADAVVEVRNVDGSLDHNRQTDTRANGHFDFLELPPGDYNITVTATGFIPLTLLVTVTADALTRQDFVLTATQDNMFTVTYDLNGGIDGPTPATVSVPVGQAHTVRMTPAPTHLGTLDPRVVLFIGWSQTQVGVLDSGDTVPTLATTVPSQSVGTNVNIFAVWGYSTDGTIPDALAYTVTYNLNGGSGGPTPATVRVLTTNAHTVRMTPAPTHDDVNDRYVLFAGWSSEPVADILEGTDVPPGFVTTVSAQPASTSVNLYAVWGFSEDGTTPDILRNRFTVTYNLNGGTGGPIPNQVSIMVDNAHTVRTTPLPTRADVDGRSVQFRGWSLTQTSVVEFGAELPALVTVVPSQSAGTNVTIFAVWQFTEADTADTVRVYFLQNAPGSVAGGTTIFTTYVEDGQFVPQMAAPVLAGFNFQGWYMNYGTAAQERKNFSTPVNADTHDYLRLYARWTPAQQGGGAPGGAGPGAGQRPVVTFDGNGGTPATQTAQVTVNQTYAVAFNSITAPTRANYEFVGWFTQRVGGTRITATTIVTNANAHTLFAQWRAPQQEAPPPAETPEEYFRERFMLGYPDDTFRPAGAITRAEVTAVLVRTMIEEFSPNAEIPDIDGVFSDVSTGRWYHRYVAWAYTHGLIEGYPDGTFRPGNSITRAEFAAMIARTRNVLTAGDMPFNDEANISDWARDYVYTVYRAGWMQGNNLGNFNPRNNITRAETAATVNRMLGRGATTAESIADVISDIQTFGDVNAQAWYFFYIVEATNSYWYIVDGTLELWTSVAN